MVGLVAIRVGLATGRYLLDVLCQLVNDYVGQRVIIAGGVKTYGEKSVPAFMWDGGDGDECVQIGSHLIAQSTDPGLYNNWPFIFLDAFDRICTSKLVSGGGKTLVEYYDADTCLWKPHSVSTITGQYIFRPPRSFNDTNNTIFIFSSTGECYKWNGTRFDPDSVRLMSTAPEKLTCVLAGGVYDHKQDGIWVMNHFRTRTLYYDIAKNRWKWNFPEFNPNHQGAWAQFVMVRNRLFILGGNLWSTTKEWNTAEELSVEHQRWISHQIPACLDGYDGTFSQRFCMTIAFNEEILFVGGDMYLNHVYSDHLSNRAIVKWNPFNNTSKLICCLPDTIPYQSRTGFTCFTIS